MTFIKNILHDYTSLWLTSTSHDSNYAFHKNATYFYHYATELSGIHAGQLRFLIILAVQNAIYTVKINFFEYTFNHLSFVLCLLCSTSLYLFD